MAKKPLPADGAPPNNPFASLQGLRDHLPPGAAPVSASSVAGAARGPGKPAAPARAVVRYERKGHGGKEVTRVEQLGLRAVELEKWLKEAKQSLGCGGTLDGEALVLQGDQRERVRGWLEKRGVGKISG
jgi:translation initiation factor 1